MRTKYFIIYIGIGIAFVAVSLWVILSGGNNAKAIRAKYKLGGALLTTWALLSAATCAPKIGAPLCYDTPAPNNRLYVSEKVSSDNKYSDGEVMVVEITAASCEKYDWKIMDQERKKVIQSGTFTAPKEDTFNLSFEVKLRSGGYKGHALFILDGYYKWDDGKLHPEEADSFVIAIE